MRSMLDGRDFRNHAREEIGYRPVVERRQDWREIHSAILESSLRQQGKRCMDCGVPFCQSESGCPLQNEIPRWNELVVAGRWEEALERLHATNNFPEFTGRLCPAPCEGACVLGLHSESVTIKNIEWAIIEKGWEKNLLKAKVPAIRTGRKVAVVGSGPTGLAAAQELARAGHSVVVFEKQAAPGGLLRYGIPDFKIEKWRIDRRLRQLEEEGVVFRSSTALGRDITLTELSRTFDAVALAVGAETPRDLPIPGRGLSGIHFAMDYLVEKNRRLSGELAAGSAGVSCQGKDVVILGGGDTGSDCLASALREGAGSVRQWEIQAKPPLERDSSTPWPLWPMKLRSSHAHAEGGEREWSIATKEFLGESGRLTGLSALRLDPGGKALPGEEQVIPADLVILALGFTGPSMSAWNEEARLQLSERGTIATDANFQTSLPGVFAAGDARRGASLVVWAIAEGRKMAQAIHAHLGKTRLE